MKYFTLLSFLVFFISACSDSETIGNNFPTHGKGDIISHTIEEQTGAIVLNCDDSAGYYSLGYAGFSTDKNNFFYLGAKTKELSVIKNNVPIFTSSGEGLSLYSYGENNYFTLDDGNKYYKNGIFEKAFKAINDFPEVSGDNYLFIATDFDEKKYFVTKEGMIPLQGEGYPSSFDRVVSEDGRRIAYKSSTMSGTMIYFGDNQYGPYYVVTDITLSPDGSSLAYIAKSGSYQNDPGIYLNGELVSGGKQNYYSPGFTNDNKLFYTISKNNYDNWVVYDGKEYPGNSALIHPKTKKLVYIGSGSNIYHGDEVLGKGQSIVFSKNGEHFAYTNGSYGEDISIIKDGVPISTYKTNGIIKNVGYGKYNCGPKFFGDSLYYFEQRGENTVLIKDGEMVDLGDIILPNSDFDCSNYFGSNYFDGSFRFSSYKDKREMAVYISESGDIAYFQKPIEKWSIFINKRKIDKEVDWFSFAFGNKGHYGFLADIGNDRVVIQEGGKCVISHKENKADNVINIPMGIAEPTYNTKNFISPPHSSIIKRDITKNGDLVYTFSDDSGSGETYGIGFFGTEQLLSGKTFENYPILALNSSGTIDLRKDFPIDNGKKIFNFTFEKKRDNNGDEYIAKDGIELSPRLESIQGELYTQSGDVLYIGENHEDVNVGEDKQIFTSLFKNKEKLLDAGSMISDFISNESGSVLAYVGNLQKRDEYYGSLDDASCIENFNSLGLMMVRRSKSIVMKQYITVEGKTYSDYKHYGIAGIYNNKALWVGCNTSKMKAEIYLGDTLISEEFDFVKYPKVIDEYLIFETNSAFPDMDGYWTYRGSGFGSLIIYNLITNKSYRFTGMDSEWKFSNFVSGISDKNIVIEEINIDNKTQRIISISPENLINR